MNNLARDYLWRNIRRNPWRLRVDDLAAKTLKQGSENLIEPFTQVIDNVGRCVNVDMNVLEIGVVEDFGDSFS
jgi:hypothetical protein